MKAMSMDRLQEVEKLKGERASLQMAVDGLQEEVRRMELHSAAVSAPSPLVDSERFDFAPLGPTHALAFYPNDLLIA